MKPLKPFKMVEYKPPKTAVVMEGDFAFTILLRKVQGELEIFIKNTGNSLELPGGFLGNRYRYTETHIRNSLKTDIGGIVSIFLSDTVVSGGRKFFYSAPSDQYTHYFYVMGALSESKSSFGSFLPEDKVRENLVLGMFLSEHKEALKKFFQTLDVYRERENNREIFNDMESLDKFLKTECHPE